MGENDASEVKEKISIPTWDHRMCVPGEPCKAGKEIESTTCIFMYWLCRECEPLRCELPANHKDDHESHDDMNVRVRWEHVEYIAP